MRRISTRISTPRTGKQPSEFSFSMLACIIMSICGFAASVPFIWIIGFSAPRQPDTWGYIALTLFLFGAPIMLLGIIHIFIKRANGPVSSVELDVARIRFAAETHMMRDVYKDLKGRDND